jgi:ribosomal protein S11
MSTTWVFIGLLAGRQMAIRSIWRVWKIKKKQNKYKIAAMEIAKDLWKMLFGLAISLVALVIVRSITGT